MRLSDGEVAAIRRAASDAFGPDAIVRLFGSRLDDSRRGGDIDLHVEAATAVSIEQRTSFRRALERDVGDRDYDILIWSPEREMSAIDRKALTEGAIL